MQNNVRMASDPDSSLGLLVWLKMTRGDLRDSSCWWISDIFSLF